MASTTSERKCTKKIMVCGRGAPMKYPHPFLPPQKKLCTSAVIWGTQFFCARIGSFRIVKKTGVWRLQSLFLCLWKQVSDRKFTGFFRYLRIVITRRWKSSILFIKSSYLRSPKIIYSWLECHLIMKKNFVWNASIWVRGPCNLWSLLVLPNYRRQWSLFSSTSQTFRLGQTIMADKLWGIWGIFE